MFVQIHMLQSMPPGNLNRDETGQPKKCLFGGVTRGRISSQCLKRNIRLSRQFSDVFGNALGSRTKYLPQMVADNLKDGKLGIPAADSDEIMAALAARFKKEKEAPEDSEEQGKSAKETASGNDAGTTGQVVFFPQPFALRVAELLADLRKNKPKAYSMFLGRKEKMSKEEKEALKKEIDEFIDRASAASKTLTVDIGLFGRMTTSDLVVNVEATCQVAHAISTHEVLPESDYFTAMDDEKHKYSSRQSDNAGAAFLGSGETETFFNSAVYYKYLDLDSQALMKHLPSWTKEDAARAAATLVSAAALATPSGKQNSFASHSVPEFVLVEVSKTKLPLSYANAFLQAVEGGTGCNLMTESSNVLQAYIDSVGAAFAPTDVRRALMAIGSASASLTSAHTRADSLEALLKLVVGFITSPNQEGASQ